MTLAGTTTQPAGHAHAPSGAQFSLRCGSQAVTVVEVGGGIRSYVSDGRPLLDGYELHERCTGARGQALLPWPNRLRDGSYAFAGHGYQLPLTEPEKHNAIHGLVRWVHWSATEHGDDRVSMSYPLRPQSGWPFTLDLRIDYELARAGLTVRTTASNAGSQPCPYGAGAHPYLSLGSGIIDGLRLQAPGSRLIRADDRGIPAGTEPAAGTPYDFRTPRTIGPAVLDTGYAQLERDDGGLAWVRLADHTSAVGLWMDRAYQYMMLFTGDSLPDPARRRRGLGVEPMTCAPNALQTGEGLITLQPGESFSSAWGISPEPPGAD